MIASFTPRMDILPAAQTRLWPELRTITDLGFVLYGGTAIALRLGHRASVDFDFFIDRPLDKGLLREKVPFIRSGDVLQDVFNTLTLLTSTNAPPSERVKISFFGGIDLGRVGEPQKTTDGMLCVASLEDLLASKLSTVLQRVESKDYFDVAAILKAGLRLDDGLASARALRGHSFQPAESLKALTYFEGGDLADLPAEIKTTLIKAVAEVEELPSVSRKSNQLR